MSKAIVERSPFQVIFPPSRFFIIINFWSSVQLILVLKPKKKRNYGDATAFRTCSVVGFFFHTKRRDNFFFVSSQYYLSLDIYIYIFCPDPASVTLDFVHIIPVLTWGI